MNRLKKVVLSTVVVLGMIGIIGSCSGSGGDEVDIKQLRSSEFTMEQKVSAAIPDRLRDYKFNNGTLIVNLDDMASPDGCRMQATELLYRLFLIPEVEVIKLNFIGGLVDKMGNESEGEVYWVMMGRDTADGINWDNFNFTNLPEITDEWVHPSWR